MEKSKVTRSEVETLITSEFQKFFPNEKCPYTIYEGEKHIIVSITWGEWKLDHEFVKSIMKKAGFVLDWTQVTESDDSDCYSADHYFKKFKTE